MIRTWYEAAVPHLKRVGWSVGSGLLGAGIGILLGTLYGHTVGW